MIRIPSTANTYAFIGATRIAASAVRAGDPAITNKPTIEAVIILDERHHAW
jgi:hypothetical protein